MKKFFVSIFVICFCFIFSACVVKPEETIKYNQSFEKQAKKDAINYVKEKYDVNCNILSIVQANEEFDTSSPAPVITLNRISGFLVDVKTENNDIFTVYIDKNEDNNSDSFYSDKIKNDLKEFIANTLNIEEDNILIFSDLDKRENDFFVKKDTFYQNNIEDIKTNIRCIYLTLSKENTAYKTSNDCSHGIDLLFEYIKSIDIDSYFNIISYGIQNNQTSSFIFNNIYNKKINSETSCEYLLPYIWFYGNVKCYNDKKFENYIDLNTYIYDNMYCFVNNFNKEDVNITSNCNFKNLKNYEEFIIHDTTGFLVTPDASLLKDEKLVYKEVYFCISKDDPRFKNFKNPILLKVFINNDNFELLSHSDFNTIYSIDNKYITIKSNFTVRNEPFGIIFGDKK